MIAYDEGRVKAAIGEVETLYRLVGREPDTHALIWVCRMVYDTCAGLSWDAAQAKHLRALRQALGLADPVPVPQVPRGRVRLEHGAFRDDRGPFNALGASLFPAVWAWQHDRARLLENADLLASGGVDYVRIFAQVAPLDSWADRGVDPRAAGYDVALAETIDALWGVGLRTQITIFAGASYPGAETRAERDALVERVLAVVRGREDRLMLIEVANEAVGLTSPEGVAEMRTHTHRIAAQTDIPVAITAVGPPYLYDSMRGVADVATVHYDRNVDMADGYDRPTRQPWGYPGEVFPDGQSAVPAQAIDNEGIGPYSSVASDLDPLRNVTRRVVAWISGNPASLWHAGPGIYFGGVWAQREGSPANFWEVPGITETLAGFRVIKSLVPPGIAGWERANNAWSSYPWIMGTAVGPSGIGCVRAYAKMGDGTVVCVPFGIRDHVTLNERRPMTWAVHSLLTGDLIQQGTGTLTLRESDGKAQLILGTFR